jgi:hypothetical protein
MSAGIATSISTHVFILFIIIIIIIIIIIMVTTWLISIIYSL